MGYIQPCLTFSSPTATLTAPGSRAGSCPGIEEAVLRVWINRRDFDLDVSGLVDIARSIEVRQLGQCQVDLAQVEFYTGQDHCCRPRSLSTACCRKLASSPDAVQSSAQMNC